jgi:ribonuclease P protein component
MAPVECYFRRPFLGASWPVLGRPKSEVSREEDLSTASQEPQANPRVPQAYEDCRWPRDIAPPPTQGPQAAHRHHRQEVGDRASLGQARVPVCFRFPRARRLRKRREFLRVQGAGRRVPGKLFQFFVLRRDDFRGPGLATGARFGITVTRKVGNAVIRNRIKRIVREGCRHLGHEFAAGTDVVILARAGAERAPAAAFRAELSDLARRLNGARPSAR